MTAPGSHKSESAAPSAILKQAFVVLIASKFWLTQAALYLTVMRTSGEVFCASLSICRTIHSL